jgi:hypothetical protein
MTGWTSGLGRVSAALALASIGLAPVAARAQDTFGTLAFTGTQALSFPACASGQTVAWDPAAAVPPMVPDQNGAYQFTTIDVPPACTVKLTVAKLGPKPLVWLASGNVTIRGTLDLNGAAGHAATLGSKRAPATPGPGGFAGGLGSVAGVGASTNGFGPGAGRTFNGRGGGAGHANSGNDSCCETTGGLAYGNRFLLPLIGGSGGAGATDGFGPGGGGAGGGAILIVSAGSISIPSGGSIQANGGAAAPRAGSGSGGSIRLVSEQVSGQGSLQASSASGGAPGSVGRIRIESLSTTFAGSATSGAIFVTLSESTRVFGQNTPYPLLRVKTVDGQFVPEPPTGAFVPTTDVVINKPEPVEIVIEAEDVPNGTPVTIEINGEGTGTRVVTPSPVLSNGTASAMATFDPGFSTITLRANW